MKQIKFITTALICGTIALSSCDKQNGDGYIDNAVYEAFYREFPVDMMVSIISEKFI